MISPDDVSYVIPYLEQLAAVADWDEEAAGLDAAGCIDRSFGVLAVQDTGAEETLYADAAISKTSK